MRILQCFVGKICNTKMKPKRPFEPRGSKKEARACIMRCKTRQSSQNNQRLYETTKLDFLLWFRVRTVYAIILYTAHTILYDVRCTLHAVCTAHIQKICVFTAFQQFWPGLLFFWFAAEYTHHTTTQYWTIGPFAFANSL